MGVNLEGSETDRLSTGETKPTFVESGSKSSKKKGSDYNINLVFVIFTICFGNSFLFGYNIGVLNNPSKLIIDFFEFTYERRGKPLSPQHLTFWWSFTNALFVIGGMCGTFYASAVAERLGRRTAILVSHMFTISGSVLGSICLICEMPELLMLSRFAVGINAGMTNSLAPLFLSEIAPSNVRGTIGVAHQLAITIGIMLANALGLREAFGYKRGWSYLFLVELLPAFFSLIFLPLFPDPPRYLFITKQDKSKAVQALRYYRNCEDVNHDVIEMEKESRVVEKDVKVQMKDFLDPRLRKPLFIACTLQAMQQLSGINAVMFYSSNIFRDVGVAPQNVEYAVLATSFVNVVSTIITMPLMDRIGRRKLLLYPMISMLFEFTFLILGWTLKGYSREWSYVALVSVFCFVISFAVGPGPVPWLIAPELFRQGPRAMAMAVVAFSNQFFTLLVTMTFEVIRETLQHWTFLIFLILMLFFIAFVYFEVPETKSKTFESIASQWCSPSSADLSTPIKESGKGV